MSYLVNIKEELDEQVQEQIRKFRSKSKGTDWMSWYHIQNAIQRSRDYTVYHDTLENFIMPNLFDENGDPIYWYHWRDPQQSQVNMLKRNLEISMGYEHKRGRVTKKRLEMLLRHILKVRLEEYKNPNKSMEKLKIMCIVGESGVGKTLASLHLQNFLGANVICSFTTRPPRPTEVEGREHHFIDIVPDRTELITYTHFAGHYYYATKWQVFGPCTVYVIDEKGLDNLKKDFGDTYDIYSVFIKRKPSLRLKSGISKYRMTRDQRRVLKEEDYDYLVINNGSKKEFFRQIEEIYEDIICK